MLRFYRYAPPLLAVLLIASFLFAVPAAYLEAATKLAGNEAPTSEELQAAYQEAAVGGDKVRILIVPGHEPTYGGAQYAGYYERELNVILSEKLAAELRTDSNLEVIVARNQTEWNRDLARYFDRNMKAIKKFVDTHKKETKKLMRRGKIEKNEAQAGHNVAPGDVAYRLYGITKWSNENDVDLMIHVHLNDAGNRRGDAPGAYTGLAIYVPYKEFKNAEASNDVAENVFDRLSELTAKSTLPIEDQGIVEDEELIALGSNNTSAAASILMEYGYIYEPKFIDQNVQDAVFTDYATETARGISDFFGRSVASVYSTRTLPYTWKSDAVVDAGGLPFALAQDIAVATTTSSSRALYALQHALKEEGVYPARPSSLINCPIDGRASACITDALKAYQARKGITQSGTLDAATRNALNVKYGASVFVPEPIVSPPTLTPAAPSSSTCVAFTTPLERESESAAVSRLQTILAKDPAVYPEGKVTGYFGPATDRAVKAFQVKKGIAKVGDRGYGVVGPATGKALLAACE